MSKRKNKIPKSSVIVIDSMTIWNMQKPKHDGWVCDYGAHGKNKYSRKEKHKTDWRNYDRD